jgi:hypothetical protein
MQDIPAFSVNIYPNSVLENRMIDGLQINNEVQIV